MNNKKVAGIIAVVLLASFCGGGLVSAFEGRDNLPYPSSGSDGGGSGGGDHKLVWTHYSFNSATGKPGQEIWLVPQYITNTSGDGYDKFGKYWTFKTQSDYQYASKVKIDGECAESGVGFWALTLSTSKSSDYSSNYSDGNLDYGKTVRGNDVQVTYLTSSPLLSAFSSSVGTYMDGGSYVIYRNAYLNNGYSPYHTVSFNNSSKGIAYDLTNNPQTLYYYDYDASKDEGKMYAMYTSDAIAKSAEEIYESYATFYKKQYKETITAEQAPAKMGGDNGTYAFCSYGNSGPDPIANTINSKTTIGVDGTTTSATTGWNGTKTSDAVYETNFQEIKLTTKFEYSRAGSDTTIAATFDETESTPVTSARAGKKSFDVGLDDIESQYISEKYTIPNDNAVHTICSETTHSHDITIDEDGAVTEVNTEGSKACVKVKYVPLEATIKSKTMVSVRLDSGVASSENKVPNNGRDGEPVDNFNIPYGKQIDVDWSHALGVSKVVKKDGNNTNVDPLSGNFNIKYSNLSYGLSGSKSTWSLPSGADYNRDLSSWNLSGSNVDLKKADGSVIKLNDTDYVKLLPGDNKTITKGIVHPVTVQNDKDNTSSGEAASSRKVSLTANKAECEFNGQEMGVSSANNYAKMSFSVDGSPAVSRTVGDATKDDGSIFNANETVWLQGSNSRMQLSYSICDGAQIVYDKAYLDSNPGTDWTKEIASTKDSFKVMNTTSDGNDISTSLTTLNNNWYKIASNGVGPAESIKISNSDQFNAKSINGDEIGANESLQARVDAGYQALDQKTSRAAKVNNQLGQSVNNTISFRTSYSDATEKTYSITTNVPYNYIIDPNLNGVDSGAIYLGSEISASANFAVIGRINEKVNESTGSSGVKYKTNTKTSKYYTAVFTIDEETDVDGLMSRIARSGATRMKDSSGKDTKDFYIQSNDDFEDVLSDPGRIDANIVSSSTDKDNPAKTTVNEATIGTKYCAVAAVWPADSHNIMSQEDSDNALKVPLGDAQTNALSGDVPGVGAYWRFEISCQTVGKKPTMSVEGYGVVTGGSVNTSTTNFVGRVFGSWSEYGLIADNGSTPKFGTGASLAYTQAQSGFNVLSDPNQAGLSKDSKCIGIQTVGNLDCENQVGVTNAQEYLSSAETIKGQIISRNGITKSGDKYVISSNISKNADGTTPIIYADDIKIAPGVTEINAILIADNNLDTCYEEVDGKEADYTQQGKTEGNSGLKDNCANQLLIRGAVFAKSITLDRTFGGGGYRDNIAAESLVRRAEIFDFDPTYIKEVYEKSLDDEPITTTYIKELPSRY